MRRLALLGIVLAALLSLSLAVLAGGSTAPGIVQSGNVSPGNCAQFAANGVAIDAGATCGTGTAGVIQVQGTSAQILVNGNSGAHTGATIFTLPDGLIIGTTSTATGTFGLKGVTSGTVTIQPQSAAGTYNFNLPTTAGTAGGPMLSGGGGSAPMTYGTISGNTTVFGTTNGSLTNGNCLKADASGNLVDAGAPCGTTSLAFSGLTSGTNTAAAMVVGTGASLTISGSGTINATTLGGATFAAPGSIGSGTPGSGAFTTLSASGAISGAGVTLLFASPPAIGGTVAAAGSFTTLGATGAITASGLSSGVQTSCIGLDSGNHFVLAAGACGVAGGGSAFNALTSGTNTTATMVVGTGATLSVSGSGTINSTTLGGATFAAPGPIGSGTASTGAFSTLNASGAVTLTGLASGTQVSCLGLNSSNVIVLLTSACGGGGGAVSSVSGTAGQITVSPTTGAVVVSLPSTITQAETFSAALTASSSVTLTGLSSGTQVSCLGLNSSNVIVLLASACGGGSGGITTVTDGTHTQTSTTSLSLGNGLITTTGSSGTAPINLTFTDTTRTANYTVGPGDMANGIDLGGSGSTITLIVSGAATVGTCATTTCFAPGQSVTVRVSATGPWTVTNSTGLTMTGLNTTSIAAGTSGAFIANADGSHLDFFPSMQAPTTTVMGGVTTGTITANNPVFGGTSSTFVVGSRTGTTLQVATATGGFINNNCAKWDGTGNIVDAGTTCGGGGGSGTVTSVAPGAGVATSLTGGTSAITTTGTVFADASYFALHIGGLGMSNDVGTPATIMDIGAGAATSDDATVMMKLATFTKTTSAWSLGSGGGCLDTGSIAATTFYHFFVIERVDTGVVDVLCSTSATAPTFPTNYTKKRRIGANKTDGSSHWSTFKQVRPGPTPIFYLGTPVLDVNDSTLTTSMKNEALGSVPTGVKVQPLCRASISNAGTASVILVSGDEPSQTPTTTTPFSAAPGFDFLDVTLTQGEQNTACPFLTTDTSAQIQARATAASTTLAIVTRGWIDDLMVSNIAALTACGAWQFDVSDTTGCNTAGALTRGVF